MNRVFVSRFPFRRVFALAVLFSLVPGPDLFTAPAVGRLAAPPAGDAILGRPGLIVVE